MIKKKLDIAKSKLMLEHPYFGSIASSLKFEKDDDIDSFKSDGEQFFYNDEYLESLSSDELAFVLANASMHKALSHKKRESSRTNWLWQLSMDYAINSILVENDLTLPPRVHYDKRFDQKYAEEIYEILKSEIDHQEESEEKSEKIQESKMDDDFELFLEQLTKKLQKQGEIPKGIQRLIELKSESKINWRDELYRYVNTHAKSDYRFFPPNKKYLYLGFALPAIHAESLKITVAIDTSASVDDLLLDKFLSELSQIMQLFSNYEITLIECDAKIQNVKIYYPTEVLETTLKGGGGTDFCPVFDYIETKNLDSKFLIYFTDGIGTFPSYLPRIDTLWVMPEIIEVPFGDSLVI